MVDEVMSLKKIFSVSGVVTGGTHEFFFHFMNFISFMNFLYVFEVGVLAEKTFITELTLFLCVGSPFMFVNLTDIL